MEMRKFNEQNAVKEDAEIVRSEEKSPVSPIFSLCTFLIRNRISGKAYWVGVKGFFFPLPPAPYPHGTPLPLFPKTLEVLGWG